MRILRINRRIEKKVIGDSKGPPGERKSGMPQFTEIPAPLSTTTLERNTINPIITQRDG